MLDQQTQIDPQENDEHCGLDEMILAHEQEQVLGRKEDTVSNDGEEGAVPSDLLWHLHDRPAYTHPLPLW